jgi:hypothetical protein
MTRRAARLRPPSPILIWGAGSRSRRHPHAPQQPPGLSPRTRRPLKASPRPRTRQSDGPPPCSAPHSRSAHWPRPGRRGYCYQYMPGSGNAESALSGMVWKATRRHCKFTSSHPVENTVDPDRGVSVKACLVDSCQNNPKHHTVKRGSYRASNSATVAVVTHRLAAASSRRPPRMPLLTRWRPQTVTQLLQLLSNSLYNYCCYKCPITDINVSSRPSPCLHIVPHAGIGLYLFPRQQPQDLV